MSLYDQIAEVCASPHGWCTETKARTLASLVIGTRRETKPLLTRGWVTAEDKGDHFAWVRITPDGLRALARGVEKYGLPSIGRKNEAAAA